MVDNSQLFLNFALRNSNTIYGVGQTYRRLIFLFVTARHLFLVFGTAMLLVSCGMGKGGGEDVEDVDSLDVDTVEHEQLDLLEPMVIPKTADELFNDFFYSFLESEDFRKERVKIDFENENLLVRDAYVVIYEREADLELLNDTTVDNVSMEWIDWESGDMEKYTFNRTDDGKWYMTASGAVGLEDTPNGSFLGFFSRFNTDREFQHESLRLPLTFIFTPQEEDEGAETSLNEEEWDELYEQLPDLSSSIVNIDYGQAAISQNRKTVLLEGLGNGMQMKFVFDNVGGEWKLIKIVS